MRISSLHSNFIVNNGIASAKDVEELGKIIKEKVKNKFGVRLDWEIKIIKVKTQKVFLEKNKTVAVLRGGLSSELEVSNQSARYVSKALLSLGYNIGRYIIESAYRGLKKIKIVLISFLIHCMESGERTENSRSIRVFRVPYTHSGVTASSLEWIKSYQKNI